MSALVVGNFLQETVDYFKSLPELSTEAARLAINDVSSHEGLTLLRKDVESQVEFPAGYLKDKERLGVTKKATRSDLTAIITGRDRPTSLARFAPGQTPANTRGRSIVVRVKRRGGTTRTLKKAFMVRLRNNNVGLAVRLKEGSRPRNTAKAVMLANNVYLLYGPSVEQVLNGVANERLPDIGRMLSKEFMRQFTRLSKANNG